MKNILTKKRIYILLTIILGLSISLGAVYFMYYRRDNRLSNLTTGLIQLEFTETGNVVVLENTVPLVDDAGIRNTPYTFKVKNISKMAIDANIKVNVKENTDIPLGAVRYGVYVNNELMKKDYIHEDKILYTIDELLVDEEIECKLVFWIDYYYDLGGKVFEGLIQVEGQSRDKLYNGVMVTFDANGGELSTSSKEVGVGENYGHLPTPTRSGYEFDGWSIPDAEYQELEYIESTGTQYIDTGIVPNMQTKIILDYQFLNEGTESDSNQIGCGAASDRKRFIISYPQTSDYFMFGIGQNITTNVLKDNNRHIFMIDMVNKEYAIDNNKYLFELNDFTTTDSFALFARKDAGGPRLYNFKGSNRLYSFKIYNNGELVYDYIPVRKISNNEVGLLDVNNNVFYGNDGEGEFVPGPAKEKITEKSRVLKNTNHTLKANWINNNITVTFDAGNLMYGLEDKAQTTANYMSYSISNGVVTVTANRNDGWGYTTGMVYLEANKTYIFNCNTSGTWGIETGSDTVQAFLMLNGQFDTYHSIITNNNYKFTPTVTGEYWLRLDVNQNGKTYTFSNISVKEKIDSKQVAYNSTYGDLPTPTRSGYTFKGWYLNLIDSDNMEDNHGVMYNTGKYVADGSYVATPNFIPVIGNTTIYSNLIVSTYLYDQNYNYIQRNLRTGIHALTNNTSYIRVEMRKDFEYDDYNYYLNNLIVYGEQSKIESTNIVLKDTNHTLKAIWEANKYTVTFDANGGNVSTSSKQVAYNSTYGELPTPTKNGVIYDNTKGIIFTDGSGINGSTGAFEATWSNYVSTENLIPIEGGITLYSNMVVCGIYSYDANGNYIKRESSYSQTHNISPNAKYIRIEVRKDGRTKDEIQNNLVITTDNVFDGWYLNLTKIVENWSDGYWINENNGLSYTADITANYAVTRDLIPVTGGTTLYSNIVICGIYSYDANGNFIRRESSTSQTHNISQNAAYIRIEIKKEDNNLDYFKNNLIVSELQTTEYPSYINSQIFESTINTIAKNHTLYAKWTH